MHRSTACTFAEMLSRGVCVASDRLRCNASGTVSFARAARVQLGGDTQNSKFYDSSRDPQRRHHALEGP